MTTANLMGLVPIVRSTLVLTEILLTTRMLGRKMPGRVAGAES